jgi:hypothetical protein
VNLPTRSPASGTLDLQPAGSDVPGHRRDTVLVGIEIPVPKPAPVKPARPAVEIGALAKFAARRISDAAHEEARDLCPWPDTQNGPVHLHGDGPPKYQHVYHE